ncbi:unnamed protein product [Pedinophyceae sp. YPF-701]|nr:unnamed protein product [Pedinophyceae sp. YPF-701]
MSALAHAVGCPTVTRACAGAARSRPPSACLARAPRRAKRGAQGGVRCASAAALSAGSFDGLGRSQDDSFPLQAGWLREAVNDLVRLAAHNSAVLHVLAGADPSGRPRADHYRVDPAVANVPSLWPAVARHLGKKNQDAEALVMVHRLGAANKGEQGFACALADKPRSRAMSPESRRRSGEQQRLAAELVAAVEGEGGVGATFMGTVGDECCRGDAGASSHGDVVVYDESRSAFTLRSKVADGEGFEPERTEGSGPAEAEAYGVVVQTRAPGDPARGCYILKLVRSYTPDCRCTHYSMTRVSRNVPVDLQMMRAWLV